GKKMAGQMGNEQVTTQNLEVVAVDLEDNLVLVKGAVPGATSAWVTVNDAVKKALPEDAPLPAGFRATEAERKAAAEAEVKAAEELAAQKEAEMKAAEEEAKAKAAAAAEAKEAEAEGGEPPAKEEKAADEAPAENKAEEKKED
ncbi:MAG: 50S ribosomal protein L3, partial [Pseudomonadota bacterium]